MNEIKQKLENLYKQKKSIENQIEHFEKLLKKNSIYRFTLKDAVYIDTSNLTKNIFNELKELATFDNPQVKTLLSLRRPIYNMPKKIYSFEYKDNLLKLPRGVMRGVIEILKRNNLDTKFIDERFEQKEKFKKVIFTPRDEQQKVIDAVLKKDFGLCIAPPGFGKTFIGSKVIEKRGVNTLVIVNKNMLLDQWIERFSEYFGYDKKEIGFLGKGKNKLNNKLDVSTMQSLKNNIDIIKNYSFVIVDECHHIPALTFEKIIKKFEGKYILGLSATPNRKDGMDPLIFQQLGSIAYEVRPKRKITNRLKIIESDFSSEADNFADLISDIINDEKRNMLIIEQIKALQGRKILLLTDRIEHIENLELLLKYENIEFTTIHGSLKKDIQQHNMKLVENSSLVLATSSYFGEGIDFPHLDTVIFATPISYHGRLIQYLGRIGRGGSDCLAVDILDINNRFALSSYKKRKEGYKELHYKRV